MPNRRYEGKDSEQSEFVYVDLLPNIRRPRQFNVNIILIVLFAVFFTWLLIYWPLNNRQSEYDEALETLNDLETQKTFIDEQIETYRIDRTRINILDSIEDAQTHQIHVMHHIDDIEIEINRLDENATIEAIRFDLSENKIFLRIPLQRSVDYAGLNRRFNDLPFVNESDTLSNDEFVLEVEFDAFETTE